MGETLVVRYSVTTVNRSDDRSARTSRPHLCLRHHVWMAACDDCRAAHAALLSHQADTAPTAR